MNTEDGVKLRGYVEWVHKNKDGKILTKGSGYNVITNASFAVISGLVGNTGAQTAFTYLALGTSSTAATASDTTLGAEIVDTGLSRQAATVSRVTTTNTNDTLQLTATWTATGSKTVAECGMFNASSNGTMLGHKILSSTAPLSNGDALTITYQVKFS